MAKELTGGVVCLSPSRWNGLATVSHPLPGASLDSERRALALALVISTLIASVAFSVVKLSRPTTIDVRGSAKRRISSDLSEWSASVHVTRKDRVEAYTALKKDVEVLTGFLEQAGFPRDQVRSSAASVDELSHEEVVENGDRVTRKTVFDGWRASQTANVGVERRAARRAGVARDHPAAREGPRHLVAVAELPLHRRRSAQDRDARRGVTRCRSAPNE